MKEGLRRENGENTKKKRKEENKKVGNPLCKVIIQRITYDYLN